MNLKDQARASLAGLAPFAHGTHLLEATDGRQHLRVELLTLDRLACAMDEFVLQSDSLRGAKADRLKRVAEKLSSSLTYLLEPISPIEIDAHGCTVQMRSNPPQKEADRTSYYELLVRDSGELSLCRYLRPAGQDRTRIPAEVTREVLLRLVGDFAAAASS
jgi:hypothetical protein